jgi:hypothetical protein
MFRSRQPIKPEGSQSENLGELELDVLIVEADNSENNLEGYWMSARLDLETSVIRNKPALMSAQ